MAGLNGTVRKGDGVESDAKKSDGKWVSAELGGGCVWQRGDGDWGEGGAVDEERELGAVIAEGKVTREIQGGMVKGGAVDGESAVIEGDVPSGEAH